MPTLKPRRAIVSGAARGLGEAFAAALAEAGAHVLLFDTSEDVIALAAQLDAKSSGTILGRVADVSQRADVEQLVADAAQAFGGIDLLVNNAGTWRQTPVDSTWEQALADWDYVMDTNLQGVLLLSRAVVPHLQQNGSGDIVNVSTYYVLPAKSDGTNQPGTDLYNASKWALNGFTDAWAKYLEKDNIRVNALCMGATDTPMLRGLFADGKLPPSLAESVMHPSQIAQQMMDLLEDGRTGENIGAWVGEPVTLGERKTAHKRITG